MGVHWNPDGQLDCIDEAANSTAYLRMMAADGLIRFHQVGLPANRFVVAAWGPSNTATITEITSGSSYAVPEDGLPPEI